MSPLVRIETDPVDELWWSAENLHRVSAID